MKVKDKVYYYEIEINFNKNEVKQTDKEYTVIGVNDSRLCIDDSCFKSIKYKKSYRGDSEKLFNEVCVIDWSNDRYFNFIRGYLYTSTTSKKIAYKRVKRGLEKHIGERYGKYCNAAELLNSINI